MNKQHVGKLLPVEGYIIGCTREIAPSYYQSLTHLYQPLIGVHAISLYHTLLTEYQIKGKVNTPQTHHTLMNYLALPLDEIYDARLKLEAIGLLKTFKKELESGDVYVYQLQAPFTPKEFFSDGMLSELLIHHLGEDKYNDLFSSFHPKDAVVTDKGENITASFNDIFHTYTNAFKVKTQEKEIEDKGFEQGPLIKDDVLDFNWLDNMLRQRMIQPMKILTPANKKLMSQMVVLYNLTNQDIEKALLWAINDENLLNIAEFKSACLDLFQTTQQKSSINLVNRKVPVQSGSKEQVKQPESKEDQFIQMLEHISPRQLLEDLSGGNEASTQDLKVIGDVMAQQGLEPGVMNVLVHYVLLKTDMKLTKSYLEKIASHWARKNVKTVRQAMTLAKSENQKYQQWGNNKGTNKQFYNRKSNKQEIIPDWFKERKQTQSVNKQSVDKKDDSKEDISELLKNYTKNKQSNHL